MRGALRSLAVVALFGAVRLTYAADPVLAANDACVVSADLDSPEEFYPPGPVRREEEGKVVIEFTAQPGVQRAGGIEVVQSSGNPDLDKAALKVGAAMRVISACSERRARLVIEFIHGHRRVQLGMDYFRTEVSVVISAVDPPN